MFMYRQSFHTAIFFDISMTLQIEFYCLYSHLPIAKQVRVKILIKTRKKLIKTKRNNAGIYCESKIK